MADLGISKALLFGLTAIALAITAVGFLGPKSRFELIKWGDGPRFVRFNAGTGDGEMCLIQNARLVCGPDLRDSGQ